MASLVDLNIGGRVYPVACREGEEESLRDAARLVDAKCREAIAGLGTLSEARQFLFASLLLADQLIDRPDQAGGPAMPAPAPEPAPAPSPSLDPQLVARAETLVSRLESLAIHLETDGQIP